MKNLDKLKNYLELYKNLHGTELSLDDFRKELDSFLEENKLMNIELNDNILINDAIKKVNAIV